MRSYSDGGRFAPPSYKVSVRVGLSYNHPGCKKNFTASRSPLIYHIPYVCYSLPAMFSVFVVVQCLSVRRTFSSMRPEVQRARCSRYPASSNSGRPRLSNEIHSATYHHLFMNCCASLQSVTGSAAVHEWFVTKMDYRAGGTVPTSLAMNS